MNNHNDAGRRHTAPARERFDSDAFLAELTAEAERLEREVALLARGALCVAGLVVVILALVVLGLLAQDVNSLSCAAGSALLRLLESLV